MKMIMPNVRQIAIGCIKYWHNVDKRFNYDGTSYMSEESGFDDRETLQAVEAALRDAYVQGFKAGQME